MYDFEKNERSFYGATAEPAEKQGHSAAASAEERLRDRLMLYVGAVRIPPELGLRLALEAMERTAGCGDEAEQGDRFASAMQYLKNRIFEEGFDAESFENEFEAYRSPYFCVPPYNRRTMPPAQISCRGTFRRSARGDAEDAGKEAAPRWMASASWRRWIFLALILMPSIAGTFFMASVLPDKGRTLVEMTICLLFGVLFAWISTGFWTALFGFLTLVSHDTKSYVVPDPDGPLPRLPDSVRTAILVPVYNEDPKRVAAGIEATWRSLAATGYGAQFDFFILSDSTDPDFWVREEAMWHTLRTLFGDSCAIYYRHRPSNTKRKSGNISNFCRRWGQNYAYMIVFDADSVMAGETMVRMVDAMERNAKIGILQTTPKGVGRETLLARVQQFSSSLYGPLFSAGQNFWLLGDAQYWGHNAIIRREPFMRFCELPRLPGRAPLGGEILSHDFVESALIRRAGYEVWIAPNLGGSYEETPPTLIDELKRDRRWCQGNLQHMRLVLARGIFPMHRALFVNGILSYVSALLWLIFLVSSSWQAVANVFRTPNYFPSHNMLFPQWHVWYPEWSLALLGYTAAILFVPKILCLFWVATGERKPNRYGETGKLAAGVACECIVSMLLAPVRMIYHSYFVLTTLCGRAVGWGAQSRDDRGTSWKEAWQAHWWPTALALAWGSLLLFATPSFFVWMMPILIPLLISVPLSVVMSKASLGVKARELGLFLIPEERETPRELENLQKAMAESRESYTPLKIPDASGFIRTVADPWLNALHRRLNARSKTQAAENLIEKALFQPDTLSRTEKIKILNAPASLHKLHRRVWMISDASASKRWHLE